MVYVVDIGKILALSQSTETNYHFLRIITTIDKNDALAMSGRIECSFKEFRLASQKLFGIACFIGRFEGASHNRAGAIREARPSVRLEGELIDEKVDCPTTVFRDYDHATRCQAIQPRRRLLIIAEGRRKSDAPRQACTIQGLS